VDPALLNNVLTAGWKLEQKAMTDNPEITAADLFLIQAMIADVDLQQIRPAYINLVEMLRNAGVQVSDRRAVKLQRLIAASALLCKRTVAIPSDMWVMRYIWDNEDQQEIIAGIINSVVAADKTEANQHPRATENILPNADEIFKEVEAMDKKWDDAQLPLAERTMIKDRLRYLNGRCEWIGNEVQRNFVQEPIDALWQKIIHSA